MRIAIVVPTYNERDNISTLCRRIEEWYPQLDVIVVDDDSPDGTGRWVAERACGSPRLHLIRRSGRRGFASAVIEGFRYALASGARLLLEMDADLSHNPSHIHELLRHLRHHDVVIGSRYLPGGGTRNWGLMRRCLSRGANEFARRLLALPVTDCTSGFRGYRREVLEALDLCRIRTEGYAFLIEMTFLCQRRGYRIGQVPILFVDRRFGQSKISRRIIWEAFWLVLRLARERGRPRRGN